MHYQVFETSIMKPYYDTYKAAKKQLEQFYEMNLFPNVVISDADLQRGHFSEGSIFFNYENHGIRQSVRVIPYMNQKATMHGFKHPIVIGTKDMSITVVFNANPYGQLGMDGIVKIRQSSIHQFNFMIGYSLIMGKLSSGLITPEAVLSLGNLTSSAHSGSMSQALAKSYSLDYNVQLNIQIVCSIFYYRVGLMLSDKEAIELTHISTKIPIEQVKLIASNEDVMDMVDIHGLAVALSSSCQSERLVDIRTITLYTMLKQYWIGENGAELICAAYEIPALWAFLCYNAMEHVLYKRNNLSEILKINSKQHDSQQLTHGMRRILSNEE